MELLMNDQSPKSEQPTLFDTLNATSSPELADGVLLSNLPDGLKTVLCGQVLAPANLSAQQEKDSLKPMNGTCGPPSSISSRSADLSMSLGSRLQAQLTTAGLMEYRQTWKVKATPAGRLYWAHTAFSAPIKDKGFIGWPTPITNDATGSTHCYGKTLSDGRKEKLWKLPGAAKLAGWTTPDARAMNDGESLTTWDARQVKNKAKHGNGNGAGMPIAIQCKTIVSWAAPAARDHKDTGNLENSKFRKDGKERNDTLARQAFGLIPFPSYAQTANIAGFQLNPRFSLWLMGFPTSWHDAGVSALRSYMEQETPSFPKLRRNSSKHTLIQ